MFLSFIVPVYNTEDFVSECLDSLIEQDIKKSEYEIICVNDGSTDGSSRILQEYESLYDIIRVINKENGGVSSARNIGLEMAKGDYIWFFDSDDVLRPNSLGYIKKHIDDKKPEKVRIGTYIFSGDVDDCLKNTELKTNSQFHDTAVWNQILSRDFLITHNCRFNTGISHGEDTLYMFEVNIHNPRYSELDMPFYLYRNRPGSAITAQNPTINEKKIKSFFVAAKIMKNYYEKNIGDAEKTANLLMMFIWSTMSECAKLSVKNQKLLLKEAKENGIFPYKRPKECTLVKSYQTTRTDIIGKIFDWIYIHTHTKTGFFLMRIWNKIHYIHTSK